MDKRILILGSIITVFFLIMTSFSSVAGFQSNTISSIRKTEKIRNEMILKYGTVSKIIQQLSDLHCDCEEDTTIGWNYPIICILLTPLVILSLILYFWYDDDTLGNIMVNIGEKLNCEWF
jgi:hypothetical protein